TNLGEGIRIPGGWKLAGLAPLTNTTIRAHGYTVSGRGNGSAWLVETIIGAPVFLGQPTSRTNNFGTAAMFSVSAGGTEPLSYQWLKDGMALVNGGKTAGALTATLTVSNLSGADAG